MTVLSKSGLETIDYGQQGWSAIITSNMQLLNDKAVIQNQDGHQLIMVPASPAPDAEIDASRLHISQDEIANKLYFKWKKSDSTVLTAEIPTIGGIPAYFLRVDGFLRVITGLEPTLIYQSSTIIKVRLLRQIAGSGGTTTIDINKNGTSIFTDPANRPSVDATAGDNAVSIANVSVIVADGDIITLDIDTVEDGEPQGLYVDILMG